MRAPRGLVARVRRFIVERDLIRQGERVLAGVSGGADSTSLLLLLAALRRSLHIEVVAAHFDHGLRGHRAAGREAAFVRSLCDRLDVEFHTGGGDVRAHAKGTRTSIEDAARGLRYRFLAGVARAERCTAVAVGHTRDDQAETVLLHLLRGSGLRGIAGMTPDARWPLGGRDRPRLVRPLLACSRDDTLACCTAAGVTPIDDPSNRSRAYTRNRLRHDLLPAMRNYNPRVDHALARLAEGAAGDIDVLETMAAQAIESRRVGDATIRLSRARLREMPASLQAHAVRLAVRQLLGDERGLSERHVRAALDASRGGAGARLDLPRGVQATVTRTSVVLSTAPSNERTPLPSRSRRLALPGSTSFGPWDIEVRELARRPRSPASKDAWTAYLDLDACGGPLGVRRRRPGDRFQPLGMSLAKKLQDFFVDAQVPREERDSVPLVFGKRGIAWVAGQRPAEWAKVTSESKRVVRLRVRLRA